MGRAETLRKYGLTEDDYEWKLKEQDHRCAICRQVSRKALVVDHDHATGRVRGLLCGRCNTRLGLCHDSPRILAAMIVYLEDHGIHYSTFDAEWEKECLLKPSLRTLICPPSDYVPVAVGNDLKQSETGSDLLLRNVDSSNGIGSTQE